MNKVLFLFGCLLFVVLQEDSTCKPMPDEPKEVQQPRQVNNGGLFMQDLGDLLAGVIEIGLRSTTALLRTGSEASRNIAVSVGSAALPPLFNVSRSLVRVRQAGNQFLNTNQTRLNNNTFNEFSQRLVQRIQPALRDVNDAFQNASRQLSFSATRLNVLPGQPQKNPNDQDIPED